MSNDNNIGSNPNVGNTPFNARKVVQDLDAADGTTDGKIKASIWNEYAKEHGGKEIKNFIELDNAIRSVSIYNKREEAAKVYGSPDNTIDEGSFLAMLKAGKLKPGDTVYVHNSAGCNGSGKVTIGDDGKSWKSEPLPKT